MNIKKPELLAPAGDWPSLNAAITSKADSVYFGIKSVNMRHMAVNFDTLEMKKIMKTLHAQEMKGYLALNIIIMNDELPRIKKILQAAKDAKVDAVILWDMAVFESAKELGMNVHISTQAGISNFEAVKAYARLGAKRVVLARECSIAHIKKIKEAVSKGNVGCEIETFVHGAMCVSVSGRCFLSQDSFGKSANRGVCIQPCRREYKIMDKEGEAEYVLGKDYVLSPKDLCCIEFIDKLIASGIDSFKIEGRMRSPEYVKVVTGCYRKAIDAYFEGKLTSAYKGRLLDELKTVYNRGFSDGFYFKSPDSHISRELENTHEKIYLGEVTRFFKKISVAEVKLQTRGLNKSDEILFIGATTMTDKFGVEEMTLNDNFVDCAHKGSIIGIKLPFRVKPKDKMFLWKEKK